MFEEKIPIIIFGQTYEIVGNPADALYYNSLAQYVEMKMKEVQEMTNVVSSQKIAILAALNIADELFRDRENRSTSGESIEKKYVELIQLLDQTMKEDPGSMNKDTAFSLPRNTAEIKTVPPVTKEVQLDLPNNP
jgi:cell division protein ZapA